MLYTVQWSCRSVFPLCSPWVFFVYSLFFFCTFLHFIFMLAFIVTLWLLKLTRVWSEAKSPPDHNYHTVPCTQHKDTYKGICYRKTYTRPIWRLAMHIKAVSSLIRTVAIQRPDKRLEARQGLDKWWLKKLTETGIQLLYTHCKYCLVTFSNVCLLIQLLKLYKGIYLYTG